MSKWLSEDQNHKSEDGGRTQQDADDASCDNSEAAYNEHRKVREKNECTRPDRVRGLWVNAYALRSSQEGAHHTPHDYRDH